MGPGITIHDPVNTNSTKKITTMTIELIRTYHPGGTNGKLFLNGRLQCYTIELPWLDNRPRVSCIPEGTFRTRWRYSLKFKRHLLLEGVSGRDLILVHPANDAVKELRGCIAPVSKLTGEGMGSGSAKAFKDLLQCLEALPGTRPVFITIKT